MTIARVLIWLVLYVCLVVHLVTYVDINPKVLWPSVTSTLHIVVCLLVGAVIVALRLGEGGEKRKLLAGMPVGQKRWLIVLAVYTVVNFLVSSSFNEWASPMMNDGRKVLQRRVTVVRVLTDAEYEVHQRIDVRKSSGHWVVFLTFALAALRVREREESAKP